VWPLAQNRSDGQFGHRSLVTSETVLNEFNKDLIFDILEKVLIYF